MSSRIRRPETLRLALTRGDWIVVKKHLTAGETRRVFRRMIRKGATGDEIDSLQVGLSKMVVYLVDWSITDADDQPVIIRGQSEDVVADVLEMLDVDSFAEILNAVEAHERAMEAEREDEKKTATGTSKSDPTWPSLVSLDGGTNGSAN
jgi:hypothetical protein